MEFLSSGVKFDQITALKCHTTYLPMQHVCIKLTRWPITETDMYLTLTLEYGATAWNTADQQ